jgi:opacity protein-like surface antigen
VKGEKMKNLVLMLLSALILLSVPAFAKDEFSKAEAFGGFSVISLTSVGERIQPLGFQAGAAFKFPKNLGIAADFGGQYKDGAYIYEYLFGPRFSCSHKKATAFAHALFGGTTMGGGNSSDSSFSMGFGGGLDFNVADHFAVRAIQFDWIPMHAKDEWYNKTIRFGFGVVVK